MKLYIYHESQEHEIDGLKYKKAYTCGISKRKCKNHEKETIIENDINKFYVLSSGQNYIDIIFETNVGNFRTSVDYSFVDIIKNSKCENGIITGRFAIYSKQIYSYNHRDIQIQIRSKDWEKIKKFEIGHTYTNATFEEYIYLGRYYLPHVHWKDGFNEDDITLSHVWYGEKNNYLYKDIKDIVEKNSNTPVDNVNELLVVRKDEYNSVSGISAFYVCGNSKEEVKENIKEYEEYLKQLNALKKL